MAKIEYNDLVSVFKFWTRGKGKHVKQLSDQVNQSFQNRNHRQSQLHMLYWRLGYNFFSQTNHSDWADLDILGHKIGTFPGFLYLSDKLDEQSNEAAQINIAMKRKWKNPTRLDILAEHHNVSLQVCRQKQNHIIKSIKTLFSNLTHCDRNGLFPRLITRHYGPASAGPTTLNDLTFSDARPLINSLISHDNVFSNSLDYKDCNDIRSIRNTYTRKFGDLEIHYRACEKMHDNDRPALVEEEKYFVRELESISRDKNKWDRAHFYILTPEKKAEQMATRFRDMMTLEPFNMAFFDSYPSWKNQDITQVHNNLIHAQKSYDLKDQYFRQATEKYERLKSVTSYLNTLHPNSPRANDIVKQVSPLIKQCSSLENVSAHQQEKFLEIIEQRKNMPAGHNLFIRPPRLNL